MLHIHLVTSNCCLVFYLSYLFSWGWKMAHPQFHAVPHWLSLDMFWWDLLWDRYPDVGSMYHKVQVYIILLSWTGLLSKAVEQFTLYQEVMKTPISLSPCWQLVFFNFLIFAKLIGAKWNLIASICISLIISELGHLFAYLLAIM